MQSFTTVFFAILLVSTAIVPTSGAPHKGKHVICAAKILRTMNELCNQRSDLDHLKRKAFECCVENCDIIEMMSFCAPSRESQEDI